MSTAESSEGKNYPADTTKSSLHDLERQVSPEKLSAEFKQKIQDTIETKIDAVDFFSMDAGRGFIFKIYNSRNIDKIVANKPLVGNDGGLTFEGKMLVAYQKEIIEELAQLDGTIRKLEANYENMSDNYIKDRAQLFNSIVSDVFSTPFGIILSPLLLLRFGWDIQSIIVHDMFAASRTRKEENRMIDKAVADVNLLEKLSIEGIPNNVTEIKI